MGTPQGSIFNDGLCENCKLLADRICYISEPNQIMSQSSSCYWTNRVFVPVVITDGTAMNISVLLKPIKLLLMHQKCYVHLSTNIPACTAWTMLLNLGFSSGRRLATPIFLLNVHASQSRTSLGTDSACRSLSSSSVSSRRLQSGKSSNDSLGLFVNYPSESRFSIFCLT